MGEAFFFRCQSVGFRDLVTPFRWGGAIVVLSVAQSELCRLALEALVEVGVLTDFHKDIVSSPLLFECADLGCFELKDFYDVGVTGVFKEAGSN